jgi:uncharacterized lipoprotein YddW (UPF0748 family)
LRKVLAGLVLSCLVMAHAQNPAGELLALPPPAPAAGGQTANLTNPAFMRAMIVDAVGPSLKSPQAVKQMVEDVRAAGFNTIIAQVRAFGDAYYESAIVPRAADISGEFDPLKTLLAEAKTGEKPLKVYAMLVTYRVWSRNLPHSMPPDHVLTKNPGWVCETVDGAKDFGDSGVEAWLDPGVTEVQDHLALVAVDLVKNYEVDGILLDRLRYPDNTLKSGYNAAAVERFNKEKGKSGKPDPQDAEWIAWKRDQVTAALRKVREAVKGAKPHVVVGANSITFGAAPASLDEYRRSDAYARTLQDWVAWGQDGLIDVNLLMNYKQADRSAADFDRWARFAFDQAGKARVVVGVGAWLNEPAQTAAMMLLPILDSRASGVAVSSYHSPVKAGSDTARAFDAFRKVLDPVYVGSRSKEIAAVPAADAMDALARLNSLAVALGLRAGAPEAPSPPGLTNLSFATVPALEPTPSAGPGLPPLPGTAPGATLPPLPSAAPAGPALPPLPAPTAPISVPPLTAPAVSAPAVSAPPALAPLPSALATPAPTPAPGAPDRPAMDQSVMSMPPFAAAAAPTPSFMPAGTRGMPPDVINRSSVNIPMVAGETNWQGGAMAGQGYKPQPIQAPTINADTNGSRVDPPPMAAPVAMKTDVSDPNSIFVPRTQPTGLKNHASREGRTPISARPAPASAPLEVIVLNNGKQFVGRVLDRAEQVTIQLENGGTIKIPVARLVETRPATGLMESAPQ